MQKSQTISWASLVKQFALQRSLRHAVSVFEANKCRVSQSTVSCRGIPNMSGSKSSAKGSPPRERKIRHAPFVMFSQATRFLFSPFFSALSFFLLQMLWTRCQFDMSPYNSAITVSKSSTICSTAFSKPDLM